jgi:hypothetical protein
MQESWFLLKVLATALGAADTGMALVLLFTGHVGSTIKTLIYMHIFSYAPPLIASLAGLISLSSFVALLLFWVIPVIIIHSFWFYIKESSLTFEATLNLMLLMNFVEITLIHFYWKY